METGVEGVGPARGWFRRGLRGGDMTDLSRPAQPVGSQALGGQTGDGDV